MRKPNKYKKVAKPKSLWMMIIAVVLSSIVVVVNVIAVMAYKPDQIAQAKFEEMARDYYENFFWERIDDKSVLADYYKGHYIKLTTLLAFDGGKFLDNSGYFEKFNCDKAQTYVKITPVEPYGQKDYEMEAVYSCKF